MSRRAVWPAASRRPDVSNAEAAAVRLHRRQVVAGPGPVAPRPDWHNVWLDPATCVSHCPELRHARQRDADGREWMLVGIAAQTLEEAPDPLAQIAVTHSAAVPDLHDSWAGRWLLIGDGRVHVDASALLGCFFGADAAGRTWASSSAALIAEAISPGQPLVSDARELRYEQGVSWYPPPHSRLRHVRRLLPSQVLDLREGSVCARRLLPSIDQGADYDRTIDLLAHALVTPLRRLPPVSQPLSIGLTAGLDSRVVLAAALRADVPFVPFTHLAARMPVADRVIPPRLASALGVELEIHRPRRRRPTGQARKRMRVVRAHSAGNVSKGDAQPLLRGVRDSLEGISLGGWAFGVGKAQRRTDLPSTLHDAATGARQLAYALGESPDSSAAAAMRAWLDWVLLTPHEHLDWRDRFYLEQRLAGWQSAKEQVYDLARHERFPVVNAARTYALLLGVDEARRITLRHQRDLVERLAPTLAGHPVNPSERELGRLRSCAVHLRHAPLRLGRRTVARVARAARRD